MIGVGRWWNMGVLVGAIMLGVGGWGMPAGRADDAARDLHSFGKPWQVRVTHADLDLTVDFAKKELRGTATLTVERNPRLPAKTALVLDTRDLTIEGVTAGPDDNALSETRWTLGKPEKFLGTPLTITLPAGAKRVRIAYKTSPAATAVQWVEPAGTAGKKRPFLFTQSQAIHARSWIPLQDSPGVRITYNATIHVPEGLTAVMSADRVGQQGDATRFEMKQAIPSYLIALAVGDLVFRPIGKRTGVYAEPSVADKAANEFADTEKMVEAAEALCGPYRWGRYDILVLPPSFPFGGMENAKLTFATPTILAGDKSLVGLIAHELAHSWSGNLVTGATWRDFWLNEGFTTYLERRITEAVFGKERADEEAVLGMQDLKAELAKFPPRDEVLHIDLDGRDPDDGMTRVPYEKGAFFLETVEKIVGRERFDPFLRAYFDTFAFKSITTADFEAFLRETLWPQRQPAPPIDTHLWLHSAGLPPDCVKPASPKLDKIKQLAGDWAAARVKAKDLAAEGWSTIEWVQFLRSLEGAKLGPQRLAELDAAHDLTDKANAEVTEPWLLLAIFNGYSAADARLEQFLTSIGRRKYLMPIYEALGKTPAGKARAKAIFAKAKAGYHPIAAGSVEALLNAPPKPGSH